VLYYLLCFILTIIAAKLILPVFKFLMYYVAVLIEWLAGWKQIWDDWRKRTVLYRREKVLTSEWDAQIGFHRGLFSRGKGGSMRPARQGIANDRF
jgi:hypothetical protein